MKQRRSSRPFSLAALLAAFCAGVLVDWALRTYGPPQPVDAPTMMTPTVMTPTEVRLKPDATSGVGVKPDATSGVRTSGDARSKADGTSGDVRARADATSGDGRSKPDATDGGTHAFRLPIDGMNLDALKGGFYESRGGRRHEAIDILAPRNTPVRAVENGSIARLFLSKQGGITIYQFDPSARYCYYYAHLERYADNLHDGDAVTKGQVIGYVGTTGNAPPNTPHLHFAVFELGDDKSWWKGQAIDPYPFLKDKIKG
jgi:murein DD-endopeptidase MepM/ murein hydrolase activator NlpD